MSSAAALSEIVGCPWRDAAAEIAAAAGAKEAKRDQLIAQLDAQPESAAKVRVASRVARLRRALVAEEARFREAKASVAAADDAPLVALNS